MAMPHYEKAITHDGSMDDEKGWYDEIADLRDLLTKQEHLAEAHYVLAFLYEKQGDKVSALEQYRHYVRAAKTGEFVELARKRIEKLSSERLSL